MTAARRAGASSVVALALSCLAGIMAPPSEFVPESSRWLAVEPVMFPALSVGVALATVAALLSFAVPRLSALACLAAMASCTLGVVSGWSVDARTTLAGLIVPLTLFAVPVIGAVDTLRHAGPRQQLAAVGAAHESGAASRWVQRASQILLVAYVLATLITVTARAPYLKRVAGWTNTGFFAVVPLVALLLWVHERYWHREHQVLWPTVLLVVSGGMLMLLLLVEVVAYVLGLP